MADRPNTESVHRCIVCDEDRPGGLMARRGHLCPIVADPTVAEDGEFMAAQRAGYVRARAHIDGSDGDA